MAGILVHPFARVALPVVIVVVSGLVDNMKGMVLNLFISASWSQVDMTFICRWRRRKVRLGILAGQEKSRVQSKGRLDMVIGSIEMDVLTCKISFKNTGETK